MDVFSKYSTIDLLIMAQVLLVWIYIAFKAGDWIVGVVARKCWRWWNRKDGKALAMDSLYEAFKLDKLEPGNTLTARTEGGLIIQIHREKVERDA